MVKGMVNYQGQRAKTPQRQRKGALQYVNTGNQKIDGLAKKMDAMLSKIPRGTFAHAGGRLGGARGALIGEGLSRISGYGDYTVKNNTLASRGTASVSDVGVPDFLPDSNNTKGLGVRLTHREYIGDVTVPDDAADFRSRQFNIDPANATMFPWLSSVASKYQKYKIHGMVIVYRSTSTDYNNSGTVALVANYDSGEASYETLAGVLNSKFAISTKPSANVIMPLECDPTTMPMGGYFIDHGLSTGFNDERLETFAKLQLITQGLSLDPGTTLGQLYVTYDIELLYPFTHIASGLKTQVATFTVPGSLSSAVQVTPIQTFGSKEMVSVEGLYGKYYEQLQASRIWPGWSTTTFPPLHPAAGRGNGMVMQFKQSGIYQVSVSFEAGETLASQASNIVPSVLLGKNCKFVTYTGASSDIWAFPTAGDDQLIVTSTDSAFAIPADTSNRPVGYCSITFLVKVVSNTSIENEAALGQSWLVANQAVLGGGSTITAQPLRITVTKV